MADRSYVGMTNCYACGGPSSILLDRRMQNTLSRDMGTLGPDDLCNACAEKAKTRALLVGATQAAIDEDKDRMRDLASLNARANPGGKRYSVFPYPARADGLMALVSLSVLDPVIKGGVKKWMVGPCVFCEVEARNRILSNLSGVSIEEIMAAAQAAGPGMETDATTLRQPVEQPRSDTNVPES